MKNISIFLLEPYIFGFLVTYHLRGKKPSQEP